MADRESRTSHVSESAATWLGITISVALAIGVPLVVPGDTATDVLIGLVSFTLGYVLTMDVAVRVRLREVEAHLMRRLDAVDERRFGSLPIQRLLQVPEIEEAVRDIVSAAATARSRRMPFLANRTIERIRRERHLTERVAQGTFLVEDRREELRLVRLALQDSEQSLDAVAGLGLEAWRTYEMQEYFDLYLEHADRLRQRRIFLVERHEIEDEEMIELLDRHADAGVEVYALDRDRLSAALCRPLVLFDEGLLLLHARQSEGGIEVKFTDDPLRTAESRQDMNSLLAVARRGDPEIVLYAPAQVTSGQA